MSDNGLPREGMKTNAGGIDNNNIKCIFTARLKLIPQKLFHPSTVKTDIANPVLTGTTQRIFNGRRTTFDPNNLLTETCNVLSNRPHTTICIKNDIALPNISQRNNSLVQLLSPKSIRLKKREGGNIEL